MAACDAVGALPTVRKECMAACLGDHAANELHTWLERQDIPDPRDLMANPGKLDIADMRFDIAAAVVAGVVAVVKQDGTPEDFERGMDVCGVALQQNQGAGHAMYQSLRAARPVNYVPRSRNGVFSEAAKTVVGAHQAAAALVA
jgi:hypothetical protein